MSIYLIFGVIALASYIVQARLNSKFEKYSKEALPGGLRGCDVAQRMLAQNGLHDVRVTQVNGRLTDHYNPADKTVNLSQEVYNGKSVAAAAQINRFANLVFIFAARYQMMFGQF